MFANVDDGNNNKKVILQNIGNNFLCVIFTVTFMKCCKNTHSHDAIEHKFTELMTQLGFPVLGKAR